MAVAGLKTHDTVPLLENVTVRSGSGVMVGLWVSPLRRGRRSPSTTHFWMYPEDSVPAGCLVRSMHMTYGDGCVWRGEPEPTEDLNMSWVFTGTNLILGHL